MTKRSQHEESVFEDKARGGYIAQVSVDNNEIGKLIDPSNFRREFKKLTRCARLSDWTPNEMRHSAASLLVAMGVRVEQVADLLGRKDATKLLAVCRHDVAAAVDAGADFAGRALAAGWNGTHS